jgi:hypothetical protein
MPAATMTSAHVAAGSFDRLGITSRKGIGAMDSGISSLGDNARDRRPVCRVNFGRLYVVFLLSAPLITACGCGESEKRLQVVPVSGKVAFQAQPPVGALVVLHPIKTSDVCGVTPTGTVNNDGTFTISAYEPGDGAPPGEYVATIQWNKYDQKLGGSGPNVLPKKYANASTSPLKVTVNQGSTEIKPITIANN